MGLLEETYNKIKKEVQDAEFEPFEIIKAVDDYRRFWKPENVKTLLLAESNVFKD